MDLAISLMQIVIRILVVVLAVALVDHWVISLPTWGRWGALLLLGTVVVHGLFFRIFPLLIWRINPLYAAQQIEQSMPSLKNGLINYVLLRGKPQHVHLSVLGALGQTTATQLNEDPDQQFVDHRRLLKSGYLLVLVLGCFAAYLVLSPKSPLQTFHRMMAPWGNISRPSRVEILKVTPGTSDVFFSETLEITAQIRGLADQDQVLCVYSRVDGQLVDQHLPMQRTDQPTIYRLAFPPGEDGIQQDVVYQITAGDAVSTEFQLTVIPTPTIVVQRVEHKYPLYTGLPPRTFTDQADISAIEGTRVIIHGRANQAIRSAYLNLYSSDKGRPLQRGMDFDELDTRAALLLELNEDRRSQRFRGYELVFVNEQGISSESPIRHRIEVTRDLPPEIELLAPQVADVEVPLDGSLPVEVRAIDPDFGLSRVLVRDDRMLIKTPLLDDPEGMDGQFLKQFFLRPAELGLKPGETFTFQLVAEDNRRSGFDQAAPNISETRKVTILVTEAENPATAAREPEKPDDGKAGAEKPQQPNDGDKGNDPGEKGDDTDKGNDPGEKGDNTDKGNNPGEKGDDTDKGNDPGEKEDDREEGNGGESGGDQGENGSGKEKSDEGGRGEDQESDPHDGDVFQKVLDRLKEEARNEKGEGDGSDDGSTTKKPGQNNDSNTDGEGSGEGTGDDSRQPADSSQPGPTSGDGGGTGEKVEGDGQTTSPAKKGSTPTDRQQKPGAGDDDEGRPADGEKPATPEKGASSGSDKTAEGEGSEKGTPKQGDKPSGETSDKKKPAEGESSEKTSDSTPSSQPADGNEKPTDEPGKGEPSTESPSKGSQGDKPGSPKDGESDAEKGNAPSGEKSPDGSATNGNATGSSKSNASGNSSPGDSTGNPSGIGDSGQKQNARGTGPDESEEIPNEVVGLPDEIPESDEARLDYADKVTKMVLEHLKDQQFDPDPELLKETGLTAEQLREMVKRYEQLRRKAEESDEGRRELEETLKSLGLDPRLTRQAGTVRGKTRQIEGVSNAGTRSQPPPRFLEQFNAFKKGTARSDE